MKNKGKRILIIVLAAALVLAGGGAAWYFLGASAGDPVNVFSFQYLGMTEYWGDSQESYGPVTTSNIQTIFLSETQTVTEVAVALGDTVKKGDLLMTFDTTLSDIALERERLKVEKLKLDLEDAKDRLREIKNMRPMVIPSAPDPGDTEENLGVGITGPYQVSQKTAFDGAVEDQALVCWLAGSTSIDQSLLAVLHQTSLEYRAANTPTESPEPAPAEETLPEETQPTEPEIPLGDPNVFYVVLKITEKDMSLGANQLWQGICVTWQQDKGQYTFRFYNAAAFADHTLAVPETPVQPEIDYGSGYTSSQIAQMRSEQEKTIRDLEFQIKMAEADYKIKQTEVDDGKVYAQIDGIVVSLLSPEEAQMTQQPFMKVSGGGGFYVEGSVSELSKDALAIGQEVTVNDWNTGMVYTGTVESIGDLPTDNGYYSGMGNPNVSYYPFTVFIGEEADLQAGSYVSVMYSAASAESGIYLENAFVRTEDGSSFVFVQGADGKLEKRFVTTGKSLWGSYTEILSGITAEDFLAFPYGKTVKEGAPAVEADIAALYE